MAVSAWGVVQSRKVIYKISTTNIQIFRGSKKPSTPNLFSLLIDEANKPHDKTWTNQRFFVQFLRGTKTERSLQTQKKNRFTERGGYKTVNKQGLHAERDVFNFTRDFYTKLLHPPTLFVTCYTAGKSESWFQVLVIF